MSTNIRQKRAYILERYPGWVERVNAMSDDQVIAIYLRLQGEQPKPPKPPEPLKENDGQTKLF